MLIKTYAVEPIYQKYGFSTLMLWLFLDKYLYKIEKESRQTIVWISFWTDLLKPNITKESYKYFLIENWILKKTLIDHIRNNVLEKLYKPHLEFNSATAQIHIWKYS